MFSSGYFVMMFCFIPVLGRADPECMLGHLLKILFKNDDFMNAVRNRLVSAWPLMSYWTKLVVFAVKIINILFASLSRSLSPAMQYSVIVWLYVSANLILFNRAFVLFVLGLYINSWWTPTSWQAEKSLWTLQHVGFCWTLCPAWRLQ